ncbi:MAG: heavy-metal-associated domain-containing protein [Cryomorphaceae bacterium]|nr:heavy-metal-associated domain-containing protein [Cryomorphaceae bacterium]
MNTKIKFLTALLIIISTSVFGQRKIETTFKVDGLCEMCKKRIERSLEVNGVIFSEWNIDTKELFVVYRPKKITIEEIHQLINQAGHDTESSSAPDTVYNQIHHCCQYRGDIRSEEMAIPPDTVAPYSPEHIKMLQE